MNHVKPDVVSDFNTLFNLVCTRHKGPVFVDFGYQKSWDGIIAGQCSENIQFLLSDSVNAVLDTRTNNLVFSAGTEQDLHRLLTDRLERVPETPL